MMNKEFVPYEQALALKKLGFDEPCFAIYVDGQLQINATYQNHLEYKGWIATPTYSQAFRWFREKYNLHNEIRSYTAKYFTIIIQECKDIVRYIEYGGVNLKFKTYEEAELECLKKLIELIKK